MLFWVTKLSWEKQGRIGFLQMQAHMTAALSNLCGSKALNAHSIIHLDDSLASIIGFANQAAITDPVRSYSRTVHTTVYALCY